MSYAMNRFERVRIAERLWMERAWKDAELASELGVKRNAINKDRNALMQLAGEDIFIAEPESRYWLDKKKYLPNLRLNRPMAAIVYTQLKRLARHTPNPNADTLRLLNDLAFVLHQPLMERLIKVSKTLQPDQQNSRTQTAFSNIVDCWLDGKVVSICYLSLGEIEPITHRVHPYLIEPSPWNESNYLIGYSERTKKVHSFKIDRVVAANATSQLANIPENFNEDELLQLAWGIWLGDSAEPVRLRFKHGKDGKATQRLRETKWHPLEKIDDSDPSGDLIWSAPVANWREMLPWIRGWGVDCEVLEPPALRQTLIRETFALANVYGLTSTEKGNLLMDVFEQFITLPGKTDPPLTVFEHSSDVYHIALYLLEANKDVVRNPDLVKAGALLHDVGKIEQDIRKKQWVHQPHSAKYLQPLLEHPRLQQILAENEIDMSNVNYDDLLLICEHHHDIPTRPDLLRRNPDALLVSIADVLASSLEGGWLGDIQTMLEASPYIKLNTTLLELEELDGGLSGEIHRVDLPAESVPDALLCDLIYQSMCLALKAQGMTPLLQKNGSLWVKAHEQDLRTFLDNYNVNPRGLYQVADIDDAVFESLLTAPSMPPPGSLEPANLKFLLLNAQIAQRMAASLVLRKTTKKALEEFDISVREVGSIFGADTLADTLLDEGK